MVTKNDYQKREIEVCLSVMIEIMTILGQYRDYIVLIGGWVPYFLLGDKGKRHIGSTDIDLALNFQNITEEHYATIQQLLENHNYKQGEQPYIFLREITIDDIEYIIQVDFLSGEYGGTGRSHRTQRFQDIKIRKARGCDLSFDHNIKCCFTNKMPDGSINETEITVTGVIPFLVMKGMALWDRYKEKDAYDIYFTISKYPGGIEALQKKFQPYVSHKLISEGLGKIKAKFKEVNSPGPVWLVNFLDIQDPEERAIVQRDASERINALLDPLEIKEFKTSPSQESK